MSATPPACRLCAAPLHRTFVDLGRTPLANSYLKAADLARPEPTYPLHARVCDNCFLVQVEAVVPSAEIFSDYAYFSSFATSWVEHARAFADLAVRRFRLGAASRVVEVASNDGYLLQHFIARAIPCLGIEPAANVAAVAAAAGVPTEVRFFGAATARELLARGQAADLMVANNVLAHVPDLHDFIAGFAILLQPRGVLSVEVPHLLRLIQEVQFDTIYHEHFSYFSLLVLERAFAGHGLRVFDVEQLDTHGGSLRLWICRDAADHAAAGDGLARVRALERAAGLDRADGYAGFATRVRQVCDGLTRFLDRAKAQGESVVAYGAAAKGNTLLNVCGLHGDRIAYAVDRSPHKQGNYLPGSHLPICAPERVLETRPDYLLILAWNLASEIAEQMRAIGAWGGRFVVAVPAIRVWAPPP